MSRKDYQHELSGMWDRGSLDERGWCTVTGEKVQTRQLRAACKGLHILIPPAATRTAIVALLRDHDPVAITDHNRTMTHGD